MHVNLLFVSDELKITLTISLLYLCVNAFFFFEVNHLVKEVLLMGELNQQHKDAIKKLTVTETQSPESSMQLQSCLKELSGTLTLTLTLNVSFTKRFNHSLCRFLPVTNVCTVCCIIQWVDWEAHKTAWGAPIKTAKGQMTFGWSSDTHLVSL